MTEDLPELVSEIVDRIRQEVPGYHVVERADQESRVTRQFEGLLTGLVTRRPPSRTENKHARDLGRQRAREGLPLESMISAYHVGYREMWNELLVRAGAHDLGLRAELAGLIGTAWTWVQQASSAAADAYGETARAEEAAQLGLAHRFFDALVAGGSPTGDQGRFAQALGFDSHGVFQAVCSPTDVWSDEALTSLRDRLRRRRGTMRCVPRGAVVIALIQAIPAEALIGVMHQLVPCAPLGVGLARPGLPGASASIADAQEVLTAAEDGAVSTFEHDWLLATIRPQESRLAALLGQCGETAAENPEIAETVRGFAENDLSLTATGRALHVHANTVKYRLDRWEQLTGWDVRSWDGLSASMVGLGLFSPGR
ncbi:helix-turn-helix domain-containing protein [Saccharopolyspora sp. K220]|uniref:PucR family transcriptional regulator n=1 Tax=Saccharopolyspora soli TaxID=2926618 RepID=UPI001F5934EA|nr:helix-turn-helix domain-containing protein [Saccharopolyspora soli]MCI2420117.1 helix-turn-helix domain-containing protein [Saccharopolyspora soli]